jgi:hypothetical protein
MRQIRVAKIVIIKRYFSLLLFFFIKRDNIPTIRRMPASTIIADILNPLFRVIIRRSNPLIVLLMTKAIIIRLFLFFGK